MKQIEQKFFHYNIIFRTEPEGGFTVIIPSLPGCITYGKDLKEAKIMAIDAIKGYIASLKKHSLSFNNKTKSYFALSYKRFTQRHNI